MSVTQRSVPRPRRILEAVALVVLWVCLGLLLRPDANSYLLIGVPLTIVFQLIVRRRPLAELWVRDGTPFDPRWVRAVAVASGIASFVVIAMFRSEAAPALWLIAALVGALGAVYSLRRTDRRTITQGALCLLIGGSLGVLVLALHAAATELPNRTIALRSAIALVSLPLFFCVGFVLEEVTFRGAIDAHVQHSGEGFGVLSAGLVASLWGLWHLPLTDGAMSSEAARLLLVHVPVGIALSIFWRRSGNLAVPAFTHAFLNAVRDAMLA